MCKYNFIRFSFVYLLLIVCSVIVYITTIFSSQRNQFESEGLIFTTKNDHNVCNNFPKHCFMIKENVNDACTFGKLMLCESSRRLVYTCLHWIIFTNPSLNLIAFNAILAIWHLFHAKTMRACMCACTHTHTELCSFISLNCSLHLIT